MASVSTANLRPQGTPWPAILKLDIEYRRFDLCTRGTYAETYEFGGFPKTELWGLCALRWKSFSFWRCDQSGCDGFCASLKAWSVCCSRNPTGCSSWAPLFDFSSIYKSNRWYSLHFSRTQSETWSGTFCKWQSAPSTRREYMALFDRICRL